MPFVFLSLSCLAIVYLGSYDLSLGFEEREGSAIFNASEQLHEFLRCPRSVPPRIRIAPFRPLTFGSLRQVGNQWH